MKQRETSAVPICAIFFTSSKKKLGKSNCPVTLYNMNFVEKTTARTFLDVDKFLRRHCSNYNKTFCNEPE